jgi:F0F1-type ATP synthase assembly protein I
MGLVSALLLVVALAAGWAADSWFHTLPIFTLLGLLVGIGLAGRYTYSEFRKFFQD